MRLYPYLVAVCCIHVLYACNHWVLNDEQIVQKLDSPFFMREPHNLIAFLEQIRYNEYVERSYLELLRKREQIVEHLRFSMRFGEDLAEQAKCAMDYYLLEKRMSYLKITPDQLKRINLPEHRELQQHMPHGGFKSKANRDQEPICKNYQELGVGPATYDHLDSFQPEVLESAYVEREHDTNIGQATVELTRRFALEGLQRQPDSWKFHTLSSYYWRMRGNALQALPCARLAVMLAPPEHKDIPLLSLGTILFRMGRLADADLILSAAVEHAPLVAENHVVLASALAMKHDFNRSQFHFDEAERLDPSTLPRTQQVRNFITCLENLTKKTSKMYSYVKYMKNELKEFKKLKQRIFQSHERLVQQQLPLGARRFLDSRANNEDLHRRGQYCSTRTPNGSDEPVLFCDFYSDMQMRLESKDIDIEVLERDLMASTESVIRQVSTEIRKQFNLEQLKAAKAQMPAKATKST
ncbi:PREDICTED: tetratricopeptide repeat protein 17 [Drosophila arizonae]|uniref:Tetratricopeptide repeat protein 17 n=1 Tax=Drosophila arizonae TaxID=7263 RepID=A0ABM1PTM3_DROAR|nr:PREDICTED: tetratricopeptide repeat protein 17 [Drosophila arizonae]